MRDLGVSGLFALFCSLFFFVAPAFADSPTVYLNHKELPPGESLRVEVDGATEAGRLALRLKPEAGAKASDWLKRSYRFYVVGPKAQRALVGIPLDAAAGSYTLEVITAKKEILPLPGEMKIDISSRAVTWDRITFNAEKTELLTSDLDKRESKKIGQTLLRDTQEQAWEGLFTPPVKGPVETKFGERRMLNGKLDWGFHKGIDLKAAAGTAVQASNAGTVVLARVFKLHGRTVIVDHGQGVMTIYLHMKSIKVHPGQKVTRGQTLGLVGSTGLSTGPHVHWGVYIHRVPVQPNTWAESEF